MQYVPIGTFSLYFPIWGRNERLLSFLYRNGSKAAHRRKSAHRMLSSSIRRYDEQAQLVCCYALSLPTAEID